MNLSLKTLQRYNTSQTMINLLLYSSSMYAAHANVGK